MARETLAIAALQSGILFFVVWLVFRLVPSLSPNAKAWIWRLAFLKPLVAILPFAAITLHILPAPSEPIPSSKSGTIVINNSTKTTPTPATGEAKPTFDPLLSLWILGVVLVGGSGLVGALKISSTVRHAEPVKDEEILFELQKLLARANLKQRVRLLSSDTVKTPLVAGGFTPSIVLPSQTLQQEPLGDIRMMMAHEVAHIARRDLAWFSLAWVVQSLFFFNPVVWVAVRGARLDHESATDRHALALAGASTQTYAEMLLRATVVARTSIAPGVLPMSESYGTIHRRLEAMKHFQSTPSTWQTFGLGAFAVLIVGLVPSYIFAQASSSAASELQKPIIIERKAAATPQDNKSKTLIAPKVSKDPVASNAPAPVIQKAKGNPKVIAPLSSPRLSQTDPASVPYSSPTIVPANGRSITPPTVAPSEGRSSVPHDPISIAAPALTPSANSSDIVSPVAASVPVEANPLSAANPTQESGNVDMDIQDADIRIAIKTIFAHSRKESYILDNNVQGKVTLLLRDVPFNVGLQTILESVGATYTIEAGIYKIFPKKP